MFSFPANDGINYKSFNHDVQLSSDAKGAFDMAAGAGGPARLARDDGYAVANAHLAMTSPFEMTTVEIWGDNLTQTKYYFNIVGTTDGAYGTQATPRTFGVAVTQKF